MSRSVPCAADEAVAPGETRYAIVVSTAREQAAAVALQHALTLVRASRALSHELIDVTEHELRFRGNRALLVLPCNARSIRGYPASFICMDEAAHFVDTETESQRVADRVWAALTPSLAQFGAHGKAVVISTPAGTSGFFSEMFPGHASIVISLDLYGHLLPGSIGEATALLDAYITSAVTAVETS